MTRCFLTVVDIFNEKNADEPVRCRNGTVQKQRMKAVKEKWHLLWEMPILVT